MPNFFFFSDSGDGLFLARRLQSEGHRVRAYTNAPEAKDVYTGIIPRVSFRAPEKGEIVIFDMVKFGSTADALRSRGFKVIGASKFADSIELSRPAGLNAMQSIGIRTPETHVFKRFQEAKTFLGKQQGHWFYKPSGNQPTQQTFDGEAKDLIRFLDYAMESKPQEFVLQKQVEGTEISLEGWFDGKKWVWPFNSTVEDKRFMVGDRGPRTGCMCNMVFAYEDSRPILALKTLARMEPVLEYTGYVGPLDLNMVLDDGGEPYGLEWSARFGYDALHALSLLTEGDLGHQLAEFSNGRLDRFEVRTDAGAITANVSVPPYPHFMHAREARGLPIDTRLLSDPGVFLRDVMVGQQGPAVAGSDASVATIGVVGTDLSQMRSELLERIKTYKIPDAQYRVDLVPRAEGVLEELRKHNYDVPAFMAPSPELPRIPPAERPVVPKYSQPTAVPGAHIVRTPTIPDIAQPTVDSPTFNT